jgi:hypothetical protein
MTQMEKKGPYLNERHGCASANPAKHSMVTMSFRKRSKLSSASSTTGTSATYHRIARRRSGFKQLALPSPGVASWQDSSRSSPMIPCRRTTW